MDQPQTAVEVNCRKAYGNFTTLHNKWKGDFVSQQPPFYLVGGQNGELAQQMDKNKSGHQSQ
jgi:hypothetical protein